jgi:hypothetical protein
MGGNGQGGQTQQDSTAIEKRHHAPEFNLIDFFMFIFVWPGIDPSQRRGQDNRKNAT